MVKAQNPKPLIRSKPKKAQFTTKSIKKVEKQTSVARPKSIKQKKQKLLQGSLKENNLLNKSKKDTDSKTLAPTTAKRLVLAPKQSPTSKKPPKAKTAAKLAENGTVKKSERVSVENTGKALLLAVDENKGDNKKQVIKKQKNQEKQEPKSTLSASKAIIGKFPKEIYQAESVDEETFDTIVSVANIAKIAKALKNLVENEVATKKTSIFSDYNYFLNVSSFKIASCPKRIYKLNLKHPMVDSTTDDVLIIVPDLQRGAKAEFESTIEHYTDMFQEAGIKGLKIMPFNQLRNEFKSFESKRKLASAYDYYLCDGRIVGQVAGFCGTIFQKPRTTFQTVRMENSKNLKAEVEKALRRTAYKNLGRGDLISIPVGSDKFSPEKVAENVVEIVSQLKVIYPGGFNNIRGIDIKVNIKGTTSLPIYASTAGGPDEVPYVVGPREQRMLKLKKQTNEILSKFTITKEAELLKLSKTQVEQKRKFKEARSALIADQNKSETNKEEETDTAVPAKKVRKSVKVVEKKAKSKVSTKKEKQS